MSTELKKRTFTDTVIICIFCGATLVISLWQLICFIGGIVPSYQQIGTGETSAAQRLYSVKEVGIMAIIVRLDKMMADHKISLGELADRIGMTNVNLSNLKTGKMKGIRFETLNAICDALDCQPGDLLEFTRDEKHV